TLTPAMVISMSEGSNLTPERPAAAKMRPQLGSPPAKAVLTSGEVAIVSAIFLAADSVLAPRTSISMTRWAPSPSATICWAREPQTDSRAAVNWRGGFGALEVAGGAGGAVGGTRSGAVGGGGPANVEGVDGGAGNLRGV